MKPGRFFAIVILCVTVALALDALAGEQLQSQIQPLIEQTVIHELPLLQQEEGTVNGYDETSGNENMPCLSIKPIDIVGK